VVQTPWLHARSSSLSSAIASSPSEVSRSATHPAIVIPKDEKSSAIVR
jgi:hypothetical protein